MMDRNFQDVSAFVPGAHFQKKGGPVKSGKKNIFQRIGQGVRRAASFMGGIIRGRR